MGRSSVSPSIRNPTEILSLSDGDEVMDLHLVGGIAGIRESAATASTVLIPGGASRYGGHDPDFAEIEQRTWHGGRGQEDFSVDATKYYDAMMAWTLTPSKLFPVPQWKIAPGIRTEDRNLPGNVAWRALAGNTRYIAQSFAASASYSADKAYLWLKRVGNPGTLTLELCSNSSGDPGTVLKTVTVATTDVTDFISLFKAFDWTTTQSLTSATTYWIKVYGASTDSNVNNWQVGVDSGTSSAKTSAAGSTWVSSTFKMYYRVVAADASQIWWPFILNASELYAVSQPDSGSSVIRLWTEGSLSWGTMTVTGNDIAGNVSAPPAIANNMAFFPRGTASVIWRFRNNSGTYVGRDESANKAAFLYTHWDPVDASQIWRSILPVSASRAPVPAVGADLVFGTALTAGDGSYNTIWLHSYNGQLVLRDTQGIWTIANDRPQPMNLGLNAVLESRSQAPMLAKDLFLYISWSFALEELYGGRLEDKGPWKGAGLPSGRQGAVQALAPGIGMIFLGIDAGTSGTSSVLAWDGASLCEIFRAPEAGQRIRNVFWQPVSGAGGRLWISCGTDLFYQTFPVYTLNPIKEASFPYQHECVLETSAIDMSVARLPKLFKEVSILTENLGSSANVAVDYKIDGDIEGSTWTLVDTAFFSPEQIVPLNRGETFRIRLRFRMSTSVATTPPIMNAWVLSAFARTPAKRRWELKCMVGDQLRNRRGLPSPKADDVYDFLWGASKRARALQMHAATKKLDGIWVIAEPPGVLRQTLNTFQRWWSGQISVVLREA